MTLDEQITLYAIGALDKPEAAELERQLAADPALRARLGEERAAASALMLTVSPVAPSSRTKQQLMQRVDASLVTPVRTAAKPEPKKTGIGLDEVLRWLFAGLSVVAAAAALALGVGLVRTQSTVTRLESQVAQLQANVQQTLDVTNAHTVRLEQDIAAAQGQLAQAQKDIEQARGEADEANAALAEVRAEAQQAQMELTKIPTALGVLSQADVSSATLPANNPQFDGGVVTVFYAPRSKSALITVANLPELSPDKDYQVWLIKDGVPLLSSVFDTAITGDGRLIVTSDEPFEAYQSVGITVEPAGGRPTPTPMGRSSLGRCCS